MDKYDWKEIQDYYDKGHVYIEITKKFGCAASTIVKAGKLGLFRVRSKGQSRKIRIKNGQTSPPIISDEQKIKISKSLKEAHSEGRHPGWSFINNDKNRRSFPEKYFLKLLKQYKLVDKYTFVEKFPLSKYTFDFALIDLKVDIEIDGSQHYRTDESIKHDNKRDKYSESKGWKVYRIAWKEIQNNPKVVMEELIKWINNIDIETNRKYSIDEVKLKIKKKHGDTSKYNIYRQNKSKLYNEERIQKIKNSNIDFKKSGWSGSVAKLINIKPQKVANWMRKWFPDIWEHAWKRKIKIIYNMI